MNINDRIKFKREELNLTQSELAKKVGYKSKTTIAKIELGENNVRQTKIIDFANALNVTPAYLMGWEDEELKEEKPQVVGVRIPILGKAPAGIPIEAIEDIIGWEEIHPDMAKKGTFYCLEVNGDSMYPKICNGDIIVVRQQADVESGEIAVVYINGYEVTIKQIKKEPNGIWVVPFNENDDYKKKFYHYEGTETVEIAGKVVELRRKL